MARRASSCARQHVLRLGGPAPGETLDKRSTDRTRKLTMKKSRTSSHKTRLTTKSPYKLAAPALLPLWLELTAPLLLSLGLAPGHREVPPAAKKPRKKRAKKKRLGPRKPAAKKANRDNVLMFAKKA